MNSRTPSFWFVLERHENRIEAVRDSSPRFRVIVPAACRGGQSDDVEDPGDFEDADELLCACVVAWFRELARRYPSVQVSVTCPDVPEEDGRRQPSLEYASEDGFAYQVPLPWTAAEVGKGLSQTSIGKRLADLVFSERKVTPLDHQAAVLQRDFAGGRALLMWTMGSGKTRAAGLLGAKAIAAGEVRRVIVLAHKTNLGNWEATLSRMPQPEGTRTSFTIVGHAEFSHQAAKSDAWVEDAFVVVDESQVYRSLTPAMLFPVQQLQRARRLLCLSGTPLVNGAEDMAGFLCVVAGWDAGRSQAWVDRFVAGEEEEPGGRESLLAEVAQACAGRVSYYDPRVHTPELFAAKYPTIEHVDVRVPLTWHQALLHQFEELPSVVLYGTAVPLSTGNSYHTHTKQLMVSGLCLDDVTDDVAEIEAESPKLRVLLANLEAHHPEPQVVHSHYVEYGAHQVLSMLRHRHPDWTVRMITGATRAEDRTAWVEEFSRRAPAVIHVLIITDASATGTDVRGARAMHKLGRANNISTEQQIDGRCARYGSHKQGERLTIYNYIAVFDAARSEADVPDDIRDTAVEEMLSLALQAKRGVRKQLDERLRAPGGRLRVSSDILEALGLFRDELRTYEELLHEANLRKQQELDQILGVIREASLT